MTESGETMSDIIRLKDLLAQDDLAPMGEGVNVYLSGPVTDIGFDLARERFADAERRLSALENVVEVYNPTRNIPDTMPHDAAMRETIAELLRTDHGGWDVIAQLDGWMESIGSMQEAVCARACDIPLMSVDQAVIMISASQRTYALCVS